MFILVTADPARHTQRAMKRLCVIVSSQLYSAKVKKSVQTSS